MRLNVKARLDRRAEGERQGPHQPRRWYQAGAIAHSEGEKMIALKKAEVGRRDQAGRLGHCRGIREMPPLPRLKAASMRQTALPSSISTSSGKLAQVNNTNDHPLRSGACSRPDQAAKPSSKRVARSPLSDIQHPDIAENEDQWLYFVRNAEAFGICQPPSGRFCRW